MTMTAMHRLADTGGRRAVIRMCLGSDMGMATLIEQVGRGENRVKRGRR